MAQRAELYGDDYYSWGEGNNGPTVKQKKIINYIHNKTHHRFTGHTSQDAYKFINKYYNKAKYYGYF